MSPKGLITSLLSLQGGFLDNIAKGLSPLGTLPTRPLPPALGAGPHPPPGYGGNLGSTPWGPIDPGSMEPPSTGRVVRYDWTVTRDTIAPDGYNRSAILINGQFPGPLLEANWGDWVEVTLHNKIDSPQPEGVTLHWHGLLQKKTPWSDGVPGISQCPIAPESSFTYKFQADQYGTSWYHSHYSAQYTDGLYGPMVIYGPKNEPYDIDLGPVVLQDYFHDPYFKQNQEAFEKPPAGPVFSNIDNNLINGKGMIIECGNGQANASKCNTYGNVAKFNFTTGKTHRLRLINAGSGGTQYFRIDNHKMTVIANDFTPVVPYQVDYVILAVGQRTDILVTANGHATDSVWMRSDVDPICSNYTTTNPSALAPIYYPQANRTSVPHSTDPGYDVGGCGNDALTKTVPKFPLPVSPPSTTNNIEISVNLNQSGNLVFFVNTSQFIVDYNTPILLGEAHGQRTFPKMRNVFDFGSNSTVRLIVVNTFLMIHPMHMHGHNFQVLAEGFGTWDGKIANAKNPQRRDTQLLVPGTPELPSYVVLQYAQDNPGAWPFHCHTAIHASAGLFSILLEQPERVQAEMEIPSVMQQTCDDWNKYSSSNVVDQIDSGV